MNWSLKKHKQGPANPSFSLLLSGGNFVTSQSPDGARPAEGRPVKIKLILKTTAASFLFATIAFAGDLKKEIVGKWADPDGIETIEYKADGTFIETLAGGDVVKGKYSFPDDKSIKVEFEGAMAAAGAVVSPLSIKGDEMSVTGIDGKSVMQYQRQK